MITLFSLLGLSCSNKTVNPITADSADFQTKDIPADVPEFKREYTAKVPRDITLKVTCKTFLGRLCDGELDQPGDKWVLFDPENPADKILDREILPDVERLCADILAADKKFRDSDPKQFTDEKGRLWVRQ